MKYIIVEVAIENQQTPVTACLLSRLQHGLTPVVLPYYVICYICDFFIDSGFTLNICENLPSQGLRINLSDDLTLHLNKGNESTMMEGDKGGYRQINKTLNICAFDEYLTGQTAKLPVLPDVEQLSPRVLRILGQNPGKFTLQGTNTYVIGTGSHRLLIDTSGGEQAWSELINRTLDTRNITLSHVLITHFHGDHSGGAPDLVRMYPHLKQFIFKNDPERTQQNITDGQIFRVQGATVRALHVPGHSTDHMCFILEEEQAMFTGDNVLGHGTSAIEDLGVFMVSLQKMLDQHCRIGYSAHGITITDLASKIKVELSQKLRREIQVIQALNRIRSHGEKSATVQEIVIEIYGNSLDDQTRTLALEPFTDEVLRKLAGDGKVAFERRCGKKRWYSVEKITQRQSFIPKTSKTVGVTVTSMTI